MKDVVRAAMAVPSLRIASVEYNRKELLRLMNDAAARGATVFLSPELSLTGYTCGDLFASEFLLERVKEELCSLADAAPDHMLVTVGAPLEINSHLYNCAVVLCGGKILGAVPKTYLPTYSECDEERWFTSGLELTATEHSIGAHTFPIGTDLLFTAPDGTVLGIEISEELRSPLPPSVNLAIAGAELILNPAASPELVGARAHRRNAVIQLSSRTRTAYLYASAGPDESTADMIFSGHSIASLCGSLIAEKDPDRIANNYLLLTDLDLGRLRYDRRHNGNFSDCNARPASYRRVAIPFQLTTSDGAYLQVSPHPFIPQNDLKKHCESIFEMQAAALARRLSLFRDPKLTIGVSGGLDSTLALLVADRAMEILGAPRANIIGITMPCFGTSKTTKSNSDALMERLGITARTIPIQNAVIQHFLDIDHDIKDHSVTYENAQARERTQVLMDVANQVGGIVLGTGDLSELALGWCTYNGDHMSMYGVNAGIPKTLIRKIVEMLASDKYLIVAETLQSVLDTPVSPELLPPQGADQIAQKTEDLVGPYELHDFFLFWAIRYQYRPSKIYELARIAFRDTFDGATIKKWLAVFWRRFFNQQFKRNCLPDGIKIGSVGLSPRGDWKMPSDATATEWLAEVEAIEV